MGKSTTNSFIIERKIITNNESAAYIDKKMNIAHKIYNTAVKNVLKQLRQLEKDKNFQYAFEQYKISIDKRKWLKEVNECIKQYNLTEYGIHYLMGINKQNAYDRSINIDIVQKLGSELAVAVNKHIFTGTDIHFRKYGDTKSIENKKNTTGIIFYSEKDVISIMGKIFKLKPIRHNDTYLQEAMQSRVKYCKIVRKPFRNGYKYFAQLVLEGEPPQKIKLGNGKVGIDMGVSTIATYSDKESSFSIIGNGIEKYEKEILKTQRHLERQLKQNNPNCYNENGTTKKGSRLEYSNRAKKTKMYLRHLYRLKSTFLRNWHGYFKNRLLEQCDTVIVEPMDYKALQRKAKELKRQQTAVEIKQKDGSVKQVHKYKKRKRFGKSVNRRAPATLLKSIQTKLLELGGTFETIDTIHYKASQYNHIEDAYNKESLSSRTKMIGNHLVQRDLYSSFLIYNKSDSNTVDRENCIRFFDNFLKQQEEVIKQIKVMGDTTHNFGLKDFLV